MEAVPKPADTVRSTHARRNPGTMEQGRCHGERKLALQESHSPTCGTKLALLAQNGPIWRVLPAHGELSTAVATNKPRRANFFTLAPTPGRAGRAFSHQHPTHTPDSGLTYAIAASCSGYRVHLQARAPCQTLLCPKRRPPHPQPPVVSVFRRGGLYFGCHSTPSNAHTAAKRGKWRH